MKFKVITSIVIATMLVVALTFNISAFILPSQTYLTVGDFNTGVYDYQENIYGWMNEENGYSLTSTRVINGLAFKQNVSYLGTFLEDNNSSMENVTVTIDNFAVLNNYDGIKVNDVRLRWYFYIFTDEGSQYNIQGVYFTTDQTIPEGTPQATISPVNDFVAPTPNVNVYQADLILTANDWNLYADSAELTVVLNVSSSYMYDTYLYYGISEMIFYTSQNFGGDSSTPDEPDETLPPFYDDQLGQIGDNQDKLDDINDKLHFDNPVDDNIFDMTMDSINGFDIASYIKLFIPFHNDDFYISSRFLRIIPVCLSIAIAGYVIHGKRG